MGNVVTRVGRCCRRAHRAENNGADGGQLRESRSVYPRICGRTTRRKSDAKWTSARLGGYAGSRGGEVQGMELFLSGAPHPHYVYMGLNIQEMFLTGKLQYPVECTLLISGALDALMESRYRGHIRVETPHLDVCYRSYEKMPIRPSGPLRPAPVPYPSGRMRTPVEI